MRLWKRGLAGPVLLAVASAAHAQTHTAGTPPAPGVSCTATAVNRSAPLFPDHSFRIFNIPGASAVALGGTLVPAPPFRVRVICADGTTGETELAYPPIGADVVYTGAILWGPLTPLPLALNLTAASPRLSTNDSTQMSTTGVVGDGTTVDLSARERGTLYTSSNPLLASVTDAGRVTVPALFAEDSSARIVISARNDGLAASKVLELGPRGRLRGAVTRAGGSAPVSGAEVSVLRHQPREVLGTFATDASGTYTVDDVGAGTYSLSVLDPATGDRGRATGALTSDGQTVDIDVRLNGQGNVSVQVVDTAGAPLPGVAVTLTSLTAFRDSRTQGADATGHVVFAGFPAGDLTASARQSTPRLLGTAVGRLEIGGEAALTVRLQAVGTIAGTVLTPSGSEPVAGAQVRLLSPVKGLMTQMVTGGDGAFEFDSLPLDDGPFTLDAIYEGRPRARASGLVLSVSGQVRRQDLTLLPIGTVTGEILRPDGEPAAGAAITIQSLGILRDTFRSNTGADGRYRVDGVPQGGFQVTAQHGGATATAPGTISTDGQTVVVDVQLRASGIVGVVYGRDGVTPVGAGVTVTLTGGSAGSTATDAQGRFAFASLPPGTYGLEATDTQGNRGRTEIVVTPPDTERTLVANITFLGRGRVAGAVRDANGASQPGLQVTLVNGGVFPSTVETTTDAAGHYEFDDVFVGEILASARNDATRLAGSFRTAVLHDGQAVTADITLRATASIAGQVRHADGVTPVAGASVEARVAPSLHGSVIAAQTADANGRYRFDLLALGEFTILAKNPTTGDRGTTAVRLSTLNEVRTADVRLVGVGEVRVRVRDSAGQPVPDARVLIESTAADLFGVTFDGDTDGEGQIVFPHILAGEISVEAVRNIGGVARRGSAAGTVFPGATKDFEITFNTAPVPIGRVTGTVYAPDTTTPLAGVPVWLQRVGQVGATRTTASGADGRFAIEDVLGGQSYVLSARINDRVRARGPNFTIDTSGQEIAQSLIAIGIGTVQGVARRVDRQPAAGVAVTVDHPDVVYGGPFSATTQADGTYSIPLVPVGSLRVTGDDEVRKLRAEAAGFVRFDGDVVTVDLELLDNAVVLPRTRYDANNFFYDLQASGAIGTGTNNVFQSQEEGDTQALRLDVVVGGVPIPFSNDNGTLGSASDLGQQVEISGLVGNTGLRVTRRVYVPATGYFARYLEVLENRSDAPITVHLRLTTALRAGTGLPQVIETSTGEDVLNATGTAGQDRWVLADDFRDADPFLDSSPPIVGFLFDGDAAADRVEEAELGLVGSAGRLRWQWNDVTVPAGASVAYLHFAFQQVGLASAQAAMGRLAPLPPEALEGISAADLSAVRNFAIPLGGVSTVPRLPRLDTGVIQGRVLAGDAITPIPRADVRFQSGTPLFPRGHEVVANDSGQFTVRGRATGDGQGLAMPLDTAVLSARHPATLIWSPASQHTFSPGTTELTADVVLTSTGVVRGVVAYHNGTPVDAGAVGWRYLNQSHSSPLTTFGGYTITGLPADDYALTATVPHVQDPLGTFLRATTVVTVVAGETRFADITLPPTGDVVGTLRRADGDVVVGTEVTISMPPPVSFTLRTGSDTGGVFRFADVPSGLATVSAVEPRTGTTTSVSVEVLADQVSTVDLTYPAVGTIDVQVNYQRGAGVSGADVRAFDRTFGTDSFGRVSLDAIVGTHTLSARHPQNGRLDVSATVSLASADDHVSATLTLPAAGTVSGVVFRPGGTLRAAGLLVVLESLNPAQGGIPFQITTDLQGAYRFSGVPEGGFYLRVVDPVANTFADASGSIAEDGQELTVDLVLASNTVPLPRTLHDANNFPQSVQPNGSLKGGWGSVFNELTGANLLELRRGTTTSAFAGESLAGLELVGRQLRIGQPGTLFGLVPKRKVFVPRNGYFARYLEVLENPTTADVTVDVRLTTRYSTTMSLVQTSSGDTVAQAGVGGDHWLAFDDSVDSDPFLEVSSRRPSTVHVFTGPAAFDNPDVLSFTLAGDGRHTLLQQWTSVTVPAGGRRAVMHFVVQQVTRAAARAAAERLVQLPPEALEGLTPEDLAGIVNFAVPPAGVSAVPPLPDLKGVVGGRVLEGDAVTPVANTLVRVKSGHPLFSRAWHYSVNGNESCGQGYNATLRSGTTGAYGVTGRLVDGGQSVPIPIDSPLTIDALPSVVCQGGHPVTGAASPQHTVGFAPGSRTLTQDVVFPTGIVTGTVIGPSDLSVAGGIVEVPATPSTPRLATVPIQNNGSYRVPGLPAGAYQLRAKADHPRGSDLTGVRDGVTPSVGQTTVVDIRLEPTGAVTGVVLNARGEASVGSLVELSGTDSGGGQVSRTGPTDSLGRYLLTAVPVGTWNVKARDVVSDVYSETVPVTVTENQTTTHNVTLRGLGSITLHVAYARGADATNLPVQILSTPLNPIEQFAGHTGPLGRLTIANVPVADYRLRVTHPNHSQLVEFVTGTITADGDARTHSVTLQPVANVQVKAIRQEDGLPVQGVSITSFRDGRGVFHGNGTTDAQGTRTYTNLPPGTYGANASHTPSEWSGSFTGTIGAAEDGTTVVQTVVVTPLVVNGVLAHPGEVDLYTVPLAEGDVLSVSVSGVVVGNVPALASKRAEIYDPNANRVAQGSSSTGTATAQTGAAVAGSYTIAISAGSGGGTGGYRLRVEVNGVRVLPQPYSEGGAINGRVTRFTGAPAPGVRVNVANESGDGLPLNTTTFTGSDGRYQIAPVPPVSYTLRAFDANGRMIAEIADTMSEDAVITHDVVIPVQTTLNVQVTSATGAPAAGAVVTVSDAFGDTELETDEDGRVTASSYGQDVFLGARPPNRFSLYAEPVHVTATVEGATVPVLLVLAPSGSITGRLLSNGMPVANTDVEVVWDFDGDEVSTDASGRYTVNAVPLNTDVQLSARHPLNPSVNASVTVRLTQPDGQLVADLVFPATGEIRGTVRDLTGVAASGRTVELWRLHAKQALGAAGTGTSGTFTLGVMPIGEPLLLSVQEPLTQVFSDREVMLTSAGQVLEGQDLTLVGRGTLTGRVLSAVGTPLASASVMSTYLNDRLQDRSRTRSTTTDAQGQYTLTDMPVGLPIALRGFESSRPNAYGTASAVVAAHGGTTAAPDIALPSTGVVRVTVRDAEGFAPAVSTQLSITHALATESLGSWPAGSAAAIVADRVPLGPFTLRAFSNGLVVAQASGTVSAGSDRAVDLIVSVVRGRILSTTSAPVAALGVFATQEDSAGTLVTYFARSQDLDPTDGSYRLLGLLEGHFTLHAEDVSTGLFREVTSAITSISTPVDLDVTLPGSGTVTGTVRDRTGAALADRNVHLQSEGLSGTSFTATDASGTYRFAGVAQGAYAVYASFPRHDLVGSRTGTLAGHGQTVVSDIDEPGTGAVHVMVYEADGATPAPNTWVTLRSAASRGAWNPWSEQERSGASGDLTFATVPEGPVTASASEPKGTGEAAVASALLGPGGILNLDLLFGTGRGFVADLSGVDGFRYDVDCDGGLRDGGGLVAGNAWLDAYDGAYRLSLGGAGMPCQSFALTEDSGRELAVGPAGVMGLQVRRKVFVPADGGYARYLEILSNPSAVPITLTARVSGRLAPLTRTTVEVPPAATSHTFAVTSSRDLCRCHPALGHVFGTIGAPLATTAEATTTGDVSYRWRVTVPAGGRLILMHYAVQRDVGDVAGARAQAEALANRTDPRMFDGMTADEKAQVVNFVIP